MRAINIELCTYLDGLLLHPLQIREFLDDDVQRFLLHVGLLFDDPSQVLSIRSYKLHEFDAQLSRTGLHTPSFFSIFLFCLGDSAAEALVRRLCRLSSGIAAASGPVVPAPLMNAEPLTTRPSELVYKLRRATEDVVEAA